MLSLVARALIASAVIADAAAADPKAGADPLWDVGATFEARWGIEARDAHTQMASIRLEPEAKIALPAGIDVSGVVRIGGDFADSLEPGAPYALGYAPGTQPAFVRDRLEIELRELQIDAAVGPARLRLGKQQVVWGQADGIRILDVVNPQDFREFILDDFDDSRIPLWIANIEVPIRSFTAQLLWVPDPTYSLVPGITEAGDPDEPYAFRTSQFKPRVPPQYEGNAFVNLEDAERPRWAFAQSDYGGQISTFVSGWDLSVNAIRQSDDTPIFDLDFDGFAVVDRVFGARINVEPRYRRRTVVGGSVSRAFRSIALRGEVAASIDRAFTADPAIRTLADLRDTRRFEPLYSDEVSYLLGLDWYGLRNGLVSLQFAQFVIVDHDDRMLRDELASLATLAIRRSFWNERILPELLWYNGFSPFDGLVRVKVAWEIRNGVRVSLGGDVFYGDGDGVFGQFDGNDRIVMGFEAGF